MSRASLASSCAIGVALILLSGCKPVGPNYNRPGYNAPPVYKETGATAVVASAKPARRRLATGEPL